MFTRLETAVTVDWSWIVFRLPKINNTNSLPYVGNKVWGALSILKSLELSGILKYVVAMNV